MTETDPEYWFLPKHKQPYTVANEVVALVDGSAYMKHLYDRFKDMQAGDSLFYTVWRGSPEQRLRPDFTSPDTRLQPVILDLIRLRVVVRILAWYVPLTKVRWIPLQFLAHNRENTSLVRDIRKAIVDGGIEGSAVLDERLPPKGSHHQKSIVLTAKGEPWAYVGGIDISVDRWDTTDHSSPPERQKELLDAWHDVQCAIQGPAVTDIFENFKDRWNEQKPPVRSQPGVPPPIKSDLPAPPRKGGTIAVQRLRTLACNVFDFKRRGEQTSREGINRAIDQAKYYVYIEDQYFWPCTTIERLAQAVRRGVQVFLVLAKAYDLFWPLSAAHYQMRKSALDTLRAAGAGRVTCCHLEQLKSDTQIYVHSKFMIVDDRFVTIGSTNVGLRSHTTDSELNVGLVDNKLVDGEMGGVRVRVCEFAKELRLRIWNEHLNIPISELQDPIVAKASWPRQGKGSKKVHHAAYHSGELPSQQIGLWDIYRAVKALLDIFRDTQPWPNATPNEMTLLEDAVTFLEAVGEAKLKSGFTDLVLGPLWWAPGIGLKDRLIEFAKNGVMNLETKCGSGL